MGWGLELLRPLVSSQVVDFPHGINVTDKTKIYALHRVKGCPSQFPFSRRRMAHLLNLTGMQDLDPEMTVDDTLRDQRCIVQDDGRSGGGLGSSAKATVPLPSQPEASDAVPVPVPALSSPIALVSTSEIAVMDTGDSEGDGVAQQRPSGRKRTRTQADIAAPAPLLSNKRQKHPQDPLAGWVMENPDSGEQLTGHEWVERNPAEFTERYPKSQATLKSVIPSRKRVEVDFQIGTGRVYVCASRNRDVLGSNSLTEDSLG
ncbi:hypothetical protein K438DRAFT_1755304 [Mycena galopus ATCC 62051]|nr:hypothetical protein K438DRAFT_1755304 [Mycena galopus ATCC 62051]